ncbi:hypothetical protein PoB_001771200 [Plakobranchus ocellatus]|uniref:DUF19 domain-containing protein n=1 Tax=Plakobranchus ocellatus TaxID=259542 RepID=A0AAV3Z9J9_9GAST|nr:hypothetical protein PoB_001771200 [Plakobranchus ocellatus]
MAHLLFSSCLTPNTNVEASEECKELLACQNVLENLNEIEEDPVILTYNDTEVLDHVCEVSEDLSSCIDEHIGSCALEQVKESALADQQILEYICSEEGRALVISLANSECANNKLLEVELKTEMQSCLETFTMDVQLEAFYAQIRGTELELSDLCPYVHQLRTCIVDAGSDTCGEDMGVFIGNIWDIAAAYNFEQLGCVADARRRRRYVKRALPILIKRSKLIKKLRK